MADGAWFQAREDLKTDPLTCSMLTVPKEKALVLNLPDTIKAGTPLSFVLQRGAGAATLALRVETAELGKQFNDAWN